MVIAVEWRSAVSCVKNANSIRQNTSRTPVSPSLEERIKNYYLN